MFSFMVSNYISRLRSGFSFIFIGGAFIGGGIFLPLSYAFSDQPHKWQIGFQEAVTPVMEQINHVHNLLLIIITCIAVLITLLLLYVIFRYNHKANPVPAKFTHNLPLEIVWTAIPALIVLGIMVPSLKLLYFEERIPGTPEVTIKVTGKQWYWTYEYDGGEANGISFDSYLVQDKDLKAGDLRLLEVDNRIVIPVNTNVRILVTAADVIHSWAVPAFGVKKDAIPGRLNETWLNVSRPGVYYGQCSELCGMQHGFMPIAVEVVSKDKYNEWIAHYKNPSVASPTT